MSRLFPRFDRRVLTALLLLGLALPALLWASGGAIGDADPSVDANVTERYRSIGALTGTQTVEMRANGTVTSRSVAAVTRVPGTDRRRVRFRDESDRRYGIQVSNGSTLWLRDTDRNAVTVIELTGPPTESRAAVRLQRLVVAAGLTDDSGRPRSVEVSPLPVVPRHSGTAPRADARDYVVEFVETAAVDGRSAYVLDVTPESVRGETRYRQRLWVDSERFYPLRQRTAWVDDGVRRSVTTTYTNVTFDASVSAETFRPRSGADTTVQRLDVPETELYRSSAELASRSSMAVPDPTVPPAFELVYATRTTGRVDGVGLRYRDGGRELAVAKFDYAVDIDPDERDATVDGRPATFDYGPTLSLSWNCGGYGYTVRGTGVGTERLIEIGRTVSCRP
jgi:outer membrane lipoprotein-sorting protein